MNVRRVRVAFTKIATCIGFSLLAATWICNFVYEYPPHNHYANFQSVGAMFGLFVGASWTIKRKEVREAYCRAVRTRIVGVFDWHGMEDEYRRC